MPAGPRNHLSLLTATRQALLTILKRDRTVTAEELARAVQISTSAARQQLISLEHLGLVTHYDERNGPGRPRRHFELTTRGETLFPQLYVELGSALLDAINAQPEDNRRDIDARVANILFGDPPEDAPFDGLVANLERVLEVRGFTPIIALGQQPGTASVTMANCPLLELVDEHPSLCATEQAALATLLPRCSITRKEHRLAEGQVCTYEVSPS